MTRVLLYSDEPILAKGLESVLRQIEGFELLPTSNSLASLMEQITQGLPDLVLMDLTARENLRVSRCNVDRALALFPELEAHLDRRVGLLSGGQQQMLALARCLARQCRLLLVDELSLGLAPLVVDRLLRTVRAAADEGTAVLLVEQHIHKALSVADRVLVMTRGTIALEGNARDLASHLDDIQDAYLHTTATASANGVTETSGRQS
jgi:sulfate-transporting ATPase